MIARDNARVAAQLARSLCAGEGAHVVVSPGSRSTPLALAFEALENCRVHVVLDERAAGFVALGIGRATGRPAIALCTSGSAGAHYLPALVEASQARVPLVVLTADRPGELHGCGAPQTMPQARLFGEHARLALDLPEPCAEVTGGFLRSVAARALDAACGSPPGPVHLNVPFREPLWTPDLAGDAPTVEPAPVLRGARRLEPDRVAALAESLAAEPRGVIVCGPHAPAPLAADAFATAIADVAARLDWPILADPLSGLRFGPHDRSRVVTCADALVAGNDAARPSRILRFGQLPTSKRLCRWLERQAAATQLLVDPDGWWLDGGHGAERLVVADPVLLCRDLAGALERQPDAGARASAWTARWLAAERAALDAFREPLAAGDWEGGVVRALFAALPDGAWLQVASSMPVRDVDTFSGGDSRRITIASNRGVNGIDGTVATAAGAWLAHRRPTFVLTGDLALLHDLDGLAAAAELDIPLTIAVVDNSGGGIFGELPIAAHATAFERLFLTPQRADIGAICRALGASHHAVDHADGLGEALEQRGLAVVHVRVDRAHSSQRRRQVITAVAAQPPFTEEKP